MRKIAFSVSPAYEGILLRGYLRNVVCLSARQTAKLKRVPGGITRNGRPITAPERLHAGDTVCIAFPEDKKLSTPVKLPIAVVYEDEDVLVAEKPPAMPMYPCPGHDRDSLANAVAYLQSCSGCFYSYRPIYRIDKDTSGLVLIAKNSFAASRLSGRVQKTYLALCEGKLTGGGTICRPIGLKAGHSIQRAVRPDGERAVTQWRSVSSGKELSLIAVHLKTGRTHQIRVHFSSFGFPLAGDDMYGGSLGQISRQALHCAELRFRHPVTGKRMRFRSFLPEDMACLVKSTRNAYA